MTNALGSHLYNSPFKTVLNGELKTLTFSFYTVPYFIDHYIGVPKTQDGPIKLPLIFDVRFQVPGESRLDVIVSSVGAVPEPATWAMLIIGFAGIGATMRRRAHRMAYAG